MHPYGSSAYRSAPSASEVTARRYRYTGKERDEETGLDYFGARYYAPWLGRWTSADPLGLQAGLNLYRYGRASPVVFVDPNGMQEEPSKNLFTQAIQGGVKLVASGLQAEIESQGVWVPGEQKEYGDDGPPVWIRLPTPEEQGVAYAMQARRARIAELQGTGDSFSEMGPAERAEVAHGVGLLGLVAVLGVTIGRGVAVAPLGGGGLLGAGSLASVETEVALANVVAAVTEGTALPTAGAAAAGGLAVASRTGAFDELGEAAGNVLRASGASGGGGGGGDRFKIAVSLGNHLEKFERSTGARGHLWWRHYPSFEKMFMKAANAADEIHFNLTDLDLKRVAKAESWHLSDGMVTNAEFRRVVTTPHLMAKSTFYKEGGVLSHEEVRQLYAAVLRGEQ